jgi:hypothetical protein
MQPAAINGKWHGEGGVEIGYGYIVCPAHVRGVCLSRREDCVPNVTCYRQKLNGPQGYSRGKSIWRLMPYDGQSTRECWGWVPCKLSENNVGFGLK